MSTVRAKFRCTSVESFGGGASQRIYRFNAVSDSTVPEDRRYAKYTPSGHLTITVDNPDVSFEAGKSYYLDFTPAD